MENRNGKSALWTVGLLAVLLAFGLAFASCDTDGDDPSGGGKTVTFTLAKTGATSFTVTIDGADWDDDLKANDQGTFGTWYMNFIGTQSGVTCILNSVPNIEQILQSTMLDFSLSGKVITATLKSTYSNLTGTLKFSEFEVADAQHASAWTNGGWTVSQGGSTTYVFTPAAGITFP